MRVLPLAMRSQTPPKAAAGEVSDTERYMLPTGCAASRAAVLAEEIIPAFAASIAAEIADDTAELSAFAATAVSTCLNRAEIALFATGFPLVSESDGSVTHSTIRLSSAPPPSNRNSLPDSIAARAAAVSALASSAAAFASAALAADSAAASADAEAFCSSAVILSRSVSSVPSSLGVK